MSAERIFLGVFAVVAVLVTLGFIGYALLVRNQRKRAEEARRERQKAQEAWAARKPQYRERPLQEAMQSVCEAADNKQPITPQIVTYEKGDVEVKDRPMPHPLENVYGGDITIVDDGSGPHGEDVNIEGTRRSLYANRNPITAAEPNAMSPAELEARIAGSKAYYKQISEEAEKREGELRTIGGQAAVDAAKKDGFDKDNDAHWKALTSPQSDVFKFPDPTRTKPE